MAAGLLPNYRRGLTCVHDNASVHTATTTLDWLRDHFIPLLLDWPPYSPDLNPIENIWYRL
jgi:transposase